MSDDIKFAAIISLSIVVTLGFITKGCTEVSIEKQKTHQIRAAMGMPSVDDWGNPIENVSKK